jgi:hypothetical protein
MTDRRSSAAACIISNVSFDFQRRLAS